MSELKDFIDQEYLDNLIKENRKPSKNEVLEVLKKGEEKKGLSVEDVFVLLQNDDEELKDEMFSLALKIKEEIYGNRLVIFAPLYVTNECGNICAYCGFRADNRDLHRRTLTLDEIKEEVKILEDQGHKRILMVYGEHPQFKVDWIKETILAAYSVKSGNGEIRRINVNSAPMSVEDFKILKSSGIGTYQCFQETYHRKTYEKVHIGGKKRDYLYRLYSLDRAQEAGIDDVAMGVLFGLYDYRFEVMALIQHALHLEEVFGVGPHTISFPRIEPALGAPLSEHPPFEIKDEDFKKIVAILRIAVPYTGLILTTRETASFRRELFKLGVSQISAGSRTYPGAYHDALTNKPDMQQFTIGDTRSLDEVIYDIATHGYIPSFCTSCYRSGRTGENFMKEAKGEHIHTFCQPNALLTFTEYLEDYASEKTKEVGYKLVEDEVLRMEDSPLKKKFIEKLGKTKEGKRDLYF
ncbi:MAG: Iron-only hydrogenase maturation protein HydG [candidate division TA06 bacterium 32_111]|uniref:Iron-only hydrogenase maturation protein HydG n=2 Tax=Bacteria candidate phyla TaxID=1783234 RepID=A0A101HZ92_UNCT6|nr:MAG: Iron-only hydrogenase maturation protein HydG [candidate division TA06 bacterium 32_111]KUK86117.1 MAG: Iron-only hydrogenase maturation protein HydG [candidate division TA06 bacterium 34_109]HCP15927.1 [FeFe] hydrogenase H-cluster radical SAM maturase HydG [candidate division WOR-3 bacterium]